MMVPRAYSYSSSPPQALHMSEKISGRKGSRKHAAHIERRPATRPEPSARTVTEPVKPASKPMAVPKPERSYSGTAQSVPTRTRKAVRRLPATHIANALPPAVAALLAVTEIPPPKPHQLRRKSRDQRRVSIDELVSSWKSDDTLRASYSSSSALSVLLEDANRDVEPCSASHDSQGEMMFLHARSASSDSVPSLDADDRSVLSMGSPSTPGSLRSRKSNSNLKRDRARSVALVVEDTTLDHPLVPPQPIDSDDDIILITPSSRPKATRPKATFTSNLTTSLRALKNATIGSITSFSISTSISPAQRPSAQRFTDDVLWAHPFLFPQLSSEIRPTVEGTPTEAQRRYLNPLPLSFEEQEAPFQQALHAPYLAERIDDAPTIPMQTYTRARRRASEKRSSSPDPSTEAGRALLALAGVRQREPRENSDFLRVVVLEMNMRREGKLDSGKARIWLPPRQVTGVLSESPLRCVGLSAYD
ncbi:hypothetical protein BAUCODRAFT_412362 [Baudoinia panamericana UAMH 10762]|uniref:Uncharacterized protein n=1 Tax=Baudoinia panamericana (strain UAMH 10762) TaxID=717646 RepID=M2NFP7_BAUPA|nr:uncharacterized protein BAUCODRAFT_412362 [Baudoinia panamericana UAMH 10762]EMC98074.1 hypothetical protein BAUCODRAFT_412362 [Baudoinia panamericana UAMH 10762]